MTPAMTALWAGGCVRDSLLGRDPTDYDVATNARPDDVRKVFGRHRTVPVGASFGVMLVTAPRSEDNVEVATFRTEGPYLDGRRPDSVQFCTPRKTPTAAILRSTACSMTRLKNKSWILSAGRRICDCGSCGPLATRITASPKTNCGCFARCGLPPHWILNIDAATAAAIAEMATEIVVVSVERIAHELSRMLVCPRRVRALESLRELGLLRMILPEIIPNLNEANSAEHWGKTLRMLDESAEMSFELAFAVLLREVPAGNVANADSPAARDAAAFGGGRGNLPPPEIVQPANRTDRLVGQTPARLHDAPQLPLHVLKRLLVQPGAEELLVLNRIAAVAAGADLAAG